MSLACRSLIIPTQNTSRATSISYHSNHGHHKCSYLSRLDLVFLTEIGQNNALEFCSIKDSLLALLLQVASIPRHSHYQYDRHYHNKYLPHSYKIRQPRLRREIYPNNRQKRSSLF
jgi:hypothetical protein